MVNNYVKNKIKSLENDKITLLSVKQITDIYRNDNYNIVTIKGGDNCGLRGDWLVYMDQVKSILELFKDSWILDLTGDYSNDTWTLRFGFRLSN